MHIHYQPNGLTDEGQIKSQLTPRGTLVQIWQDFDDMYHRYLNFGTTLRMEKTDQQVNSRALTSMMLGGAIYDAFVAIRGYKNVLVVPSWTDKPSDRKVNILTTNHENGYLPYGGSGVHCFPLVHKYNETDGKLTVATVHNGQSFFEFLYKQFATTCDTLNIARTDDNYILGMDNYKVKGIPEEKFDAVILLDVPHYKNEKFKASEIKKDFAHMCTEGFELVQFNSSEKLGDRIIGRKDILETIQQIINTCTPDELKKEIIDVVGTKELRLRTVEHQAFKQQINNLISKIRVH